MKLTPNALKFNTKLLHWLGVLYWICSWSISVFGQQQFSALFNHGENGGFTSIIECKEGYLATGGRVEGTAQRAAIWRLNDMGQVIDSLFFGEGDTQYESRKDVLVELPDQHFATAFAVYDGSYTVRLIKFSEQLNIVQEQWVTSQFYDEDEPSTNFIDFGELVTSHDGEIYLAIGLYTPEFGNFLGINKYSMDFDLQWNYVKHDLVTNGVLCIDADQQGIVITDVGIAFPEVQHNLLKLSSNGNEIWGFIIEPPLPYGSYAPRRIKLQDGNLVMAAGGRNQEWEIEKSAPLLYAMDTTGTLLWTSLPEESPMSSTVMDVLDTTCDGGFVGACQWDNGQLQNDTLVASDQRITMLLRYDENGEILWTRKFMIVDKPMAEHDINEVISLSDGGVMMAGSVINWDLEDPENTYPFQRGWLVRTDACGCLVPNCDAFCTTSDCEVPVDTQGHYFISGPNPTQGTLNVFVGELDPSKEHFLRIHNARGQLVKEMRIPEETTTYIFDLSPYTAGIYSLQLSNGEQILQTEKIIRR